MSDSTVGTLVVKLSTDTSELDQGLEKAKGGFGKFKDVASGMAMGAGIAVAGMAMQAGQALIQFGADSVSAASDLGETMSKVGVVFGDSGDQVKAWAENASTALGQSKQQALDAAGTFGNLFVSMGMGQDVSADMSIGLTELASDLASFNNIDPTEALEKLRSGILGQTEPLQSLGVNLTAAAVSEKGLAMGLAASAKELTPAMLAQARYALILEQTTTAQGDFARTSDGLANQQRIQDAQWKDLQATMGEALLPVMLALTQGTNTLLKAVLPPLSQFIKTYVVPAMSQMGQAIGWIASTILPPLVQFIQTAVGPAFKFLGDMVGWVTGLFRTQGQELPALVKGPWEFIRGYIETVTANVKDMFKLFNQLVTGDFKGAGQTLRGIFDRTLGFIRDTVQGMIDATKRAITDTDWGGLGKAIIDGIAEGIKNSPEKFMEAIKSVMGGGLDFAKGFMGIESPSKVMAKEVGRPMGQGVGVGMEQALSEIEVKLSAALGSLVGGMAGVQVGTGSNAITLHQNFYGTADPSAVRTASRGGVISAMRAVGAR